MQEFIELMAEIMEVDAAGLKPETEFRDACDFNSLIGFSMIAEIESNYGKVMGVKDFLACKTIDDLYKFATKE